MVLVAGVAFKRVAKSYWFDPGPLALREMDRVIVETARGVEMGTVRIPPRQVAESELQAPLKRIVRLADERDIEHEGQNRQKADHALNVCADRIRHHLLPMKLLQAEYNFEATQVTVYFSAENRVDFRELVKDVAGQLRCKVQLHQVGARDQAKMINGVGPCGLTLCCATFLTEFAPISMKMAKDQSLFLNPVKFSGVCGKLMCCLRYEHENYVDAKRRLPQVGDFVSTPRGPGRVIEQNVVKEEVLVLLQEPEVELPFSVADVRPDRTGPCRACLGRGSGPLEASSSEAAYREPPADERELRGLEGG